MLSFVACGSQCFRITYAQFHIAVVGFVTERREEVRHRIAMSSALRSEATVHEADSISEQVSCGIVSVFHPWYQQRNDFSVIPCEMDGLAVLRIIAQN